MKTISMTLYNRPDYVRRVLGALSRCIGIERYLLIMCIEPGCDQVLRMARAVNFCRTHVQVNADKLTCPINTYQAFSLAFMHGDYNIHVEDDILLSRDALLFFEHTGRTYAQDRSVISASAYNNQHCNPSHHHAIARRDWFTSWAVALWKDRWEEIKPHWDFDYSGGGWDNRINRHIRGNRSEIFPVLARAQNIGEQGEHVPSPEWHRTFHYNKHWAGKINPAPAPFHEDPYWVWHPPAITDDIRARFPDSWLRAAEYM